MDTAEVTYTITPLPDASFIIADFCEGSNSGAAVISGDAGGTFSFNPAPGDGATIDGGTGVISGGIGGTSYTVQYDVTVSGCSASSTYVVMAQVCACTPMTICAGDDLSVSTSGQSGSPNLHWYLLVDNANVGIIVDANTSGSFTSLSSTAGYSIYALNFDPSNPPSPLLLALQMQV
ncbi:MAG: hypothetical protein R2798_06890 [Chitinophagales bacterium]